MKGEKRGARGNEEGEMTAKEWILLQAMRLRNLKAGMGEEERRKLWRENGRGS